MHLQGRVALQEPPRKHAQGPLRSILVLERTERGRGVVGPVTPGASSQTILFHKLQITSRTKNVDAQAHVGQQLHEVIMNHTCENPTWKNIPMMAIIANLPLANSAASFLVFSAGSLEVKTLKPKSPAAAAVPAD